MYHFMFHFMSSLVQNWFGNMGCCDFSINNPQNTCLVTWLLTWNITFWVKYSLRNPINKSCYYPQWDNFWWFSQKTPCGILYLIIAIRSNLVWNRQWERQIPPTAQGLTCPFNFFQISSIQLFLALMQGFVNN